VKVAIVHDWFVGGGAERVVYELHKIYPKAPIYTAYCSPEWRGRLSDTKVITSYMQHWPFSKLRKFLPPLRALWFSRLDLSGYDLVISSSGAEAKAVKVRKPAKHVNICYAPTHYYWSRYEEYMQNPGFGRLDWLARLGLKLLLAPMRHWDYRAAQRPDHMIAISTYIKEQIKQYYGRESELIFPPVDVERFAGQAEEPRRGFITAGRQTPYKRIDLAVKACTQLNLPLIVIGSGPDNRRLKRMAGKSVTFLTGKTDEEIVHYFQTSLAFIFPSLDDFGTLDYVEPGQTGILFKQQTVDSLANAISKFDSEKFNNKSIQKYAAKFSAERFQHKLSRQIDKYLV
jgi:glycosyltransferase involved in cell wall biosynthesis